jgi:hypothetical protein
MLAGMKSEQVAGFVSESMAGFIGIRTFALRGLGDVSGLVFEAEKFVGLPPRPRLRDGLTTGYARRPPRPF